MKIKKNQEEKKALLKLGCPLSIYEANKVRNRLMTQRP